MIKACFPLSRKYSNGTSRIRSQVLQGQLQKPWQQLQRNISWRHTFPGSGRIEPQSISSVQWQRKHSKVFTLVTAGIPLLLIDNRVQGYRSLSRLTVSNDQFTLRRPIGTIESIDLIPVCIGSLTDSRVIIPGAFTLTRCLLTFGGSLAINRISQGINDSPQ